MKFPKYSLTLLWDGLAGVLVLALAAVIVYLFVAATIRLLAAIDSDLAKAIITAFATTLVAAASLIMSKRMEHKSRLQQEIRQKKIPAYEELIALMFDMMFWAKTGKKRPSDLKLTKTLVDFTQKAIIWGSDDVILAYSRFRSGDWDAMKPEEMLNLQEKLLRAIRKDLGHTEDALPPGVLVSLYVNAGEKSVEDSGVR